MHIRERQVLAEVSWIKAFNIMILPFIIIFGAALLFSDLSMQDMFSQENLMKSTPMRPHPYIFFGAIIVFIAMIFYRFVRLARCSSNYLEIVDGKIQACGKSYGDLSHFDGAHISVEHVRLSTYLLLRRKNGTPAQIPITFASLDEATLVSALRDMISRRSPAA